MVFKLFLIMVHKFFYNKNLFPLFKKKISRIKEITFLGEEFDPNSQEKKFKIIIKIKIKTKKIYHCNTVPIADKCLSTNNQSITRLV